MSKPIETLDWRPGVTSPDTVLLDSGLTVVATVRSGLVARLTTAQELAEYNYLKAYMEAFSAFPKA